MAAEEKSIRWIVIMCMIFMAYLAWGFLAGSYAGSEDAVLVGVSRRARRASGILMLISAIYSFVTTSITQLPNFFSVITWHLQNRIWLPILFVLLECGIVAGGYGLQKLEQKLEGPRESGPRQSGRKKKRRKKRKS